MKRLVSVLKNDCVDTDLIMLIRTVLAASKEIAFRVSQGDLAGVLGSTLNENIQGEVQSKLDMIANTLIKDILLEDNTVRAIASEEEDNVVGGNVSGKYIVAFDPLDGSSNIDINGQIGTIFTIYLARDDVPHNSWKQFARKGSEQLCAGYILYGAATLLVLSTGGPTRLFTLDATHGGFLLTDPALNLTTDKKDFAVNMFNYRYWDKPKQQFFDDVLHKDPHYDGAILRWNAAMVGDIHRVLCKGGVYIYPEDNRHNIQNGKIRLLYEANPMALLIENAGGIAVSKGDRILDIELQSLHQRIPVILGSKNVVEDYLSKTIISV